jgi:hypothetical protein
MSIVAVIAEVRQALDVSTISLKRECLAWDALAFVFTPALLGLGFGCGNVHPETGLRFRITKLRLGRFLLLRLGAGLRGVRLRQWREIHARSK